MGGPQKGELMIGSHFGGNSFFFFPGAPGREEESGLA